jgi:asparagine synthase (glutamine-hydrolysing)
MTDSQRQALFSASLRRDLDGYHAAEVLRRHAAAAPTDDPLSLVQYIDLKTFLVSILHKVDRASMAHGLEVRVPLLDHKLVEWLSGLSPRMKLRQREGKYVFKTALRQRVPAELMYRPKMGFSLPLAAWFRGPLRQQVREQVLGQTLADSGLFNGPYLAKLVNEHEQARRDHSAVLWELLMFGQFLSSRAAA